MVHASSRARILMNHSTLYFVEIAPQFFPPDSRPRSNREIKENSPALITANGATGKEVHVRQFSNESTHKTYTFDKVFGPEGEDEDTVSVLVSRFVSI